MPATYMHNHVFDGVQLGKRRVHQSAINLLRRRITAYLSTLSQQAVPDQPHDPAGDRQVRGDGNARDVMDGNA